MYGFERRGALDLSVYPDPGSEAERTGTPLGQGLLMTLVATVAGEYYSPEILARLDEVDPYAWYAGQDLESLINELEDQDSELPAEVGKNIYHTMRSQFVALGIKVPNDVITTLPGLWQIVTRGDSGEWRTALTGPQQARIELEQPYNCHFETGALQGALEAFYATDVQINHGQCMRDGAPYCILEVRWQE